MHINYFCLSTAPARMLGLILIIAASMDGLAQPLTERLGGVTTAFTITTTDLELNSTEQVLIRRARGYHGIRTVCDGGAGYGYGFESVHLEFHSIYSIKTQVRRDIGRRKYYELTFLDQQNEVLAKIDLRPDAVRRFSSRQVPPLYTYSIDLEGMPLILLDRVATIHIDRVDLR